MTAFLKKPSFCQMRSLLFLCYIVDITYYYMRIKAIKSGSKTFDIDTCICITQMNCSIVYNTDPARTRLVSFALWNAHFKCYKH